MKNQYSQDQGFRSNFKLIEQNEQMEVVSQNINRETKLVFKLYNTAQLLDLN